MSDVTVSLATDRVVLVAGRAGVTASVTNGAAHTQRLVLRAYAGGDAAAAGVEQWVSVERPVREVAAGATEQYAVSVQAPAAAAGEYEVRLVAHPSDAAPEEYAHRGQVLRLEAAEAPPPPAPAPSSPFGWWTWVLAAVVAVALIAVVIFLLTGPGPPATTTTDSVDTGTSEPAPARRAASVVDATIPVRGTPWSLASDAQAGRVYVSHSADRGVSVIDTARDRVVATVPVEGGITHVALDPVAGRLYGADLGATTDLVVVDLPSGPTVARIPLPGRATAVAVDPGSGLVYVGTATGIVAVVDPVRETVRELHRGSGQRGLALDASDGVLYATDATAGSLAVVDAATGEVRSAVRVGAGPLSLALDPAEGRIYVANGVGRTVSVVDPAAGSVVATIPMAEEPQRVAADGQARAVYVTGSDGAVSVIDTRTDQVAGTVAVSRWLSDVVVDDATGRVLVGNYHDDTVSVLVAE